MLSHYVSTVPPKPFNLKGVPYPDCFAGQFRISLIAQNKNIVRLIEKA
jgi:hypothetical protein